MLIIAAGCVEFASRKPEAEADPSSDLDAVADRLAKTAYARYCEDESERLVHEPVALPVAWEAAADELADHWSNIARAPVGAEAHRPDLAGQIESVAATYRRIPSGRLVVLGEGGAGKTTVLVRLAIELLSAYDTGARVPVVLNVTGWDPQKSSLREWLVAAVDDVFPSLAVAQTSNTHPAGALVGGDRILPLLDGLDELAAPAQAQALAQLSRVPDIPLVLAARSGEYAACVAASDVLTAAAVVELRPLQLDDVAAYLPRTVGGHRVTVWDATLAAIRLDPPSESARRLGEVLAVPLMVYLARQSYSEVHGADPADLLDSDRYPRADVLRQHLLARFVPAVYQQKSPQLHAWSESAKPVLHDSLRRIAGLLDDRGRNDLPWWEMAYLVPYRTRYRVLAALVQVLDGLLYGAGATVLAGPAYGVAVGLGVTVAGGLAVRLERGLDRPPSRSRFDLRGLTHVVDIDGWFLWLLLWLGGGLASSFAGSFAVAVGAGLLVALVSRALGASALGVVFGAAVTAIIGWRTGSPTGVVPALLAALTVGAIVGLVHGGLMAVESALTTYQDRDPTDFVESLRSDRRQALARALLIDPLVGFAAGYAVATVGPPVQSIAGGLVVGAMFGLVGGLGLGTQAWGHWAVLVRLWLPLRRQMPWRTRLFLDDARRRGILRSAGANFQFRHRDLQRRLADELDLGRIGDR